jgi:hypothetical protein
VSDVFSGVPWPERKSRADSTTTRDRLRHRDTDINTLFSYQVTSAFKRACVYPWIE